MMGSVVFFTFYLVIAYLAYGWKGVFWGIPLIFVAKYGFWAAANSIRDEVLEGLREKLERKEGK